VEKPFQVEVQRTDNATVFVVSGELDLSSSPELEAAVGQLDSRDTGVVVLDLTAVEFMDSAGLAVVVKAHQQAESAGRAFGLVPGSEQVRRLLSLTGIERRMTVAQTPEELLGGG
jgi:anti-sigma B factor antagonist